MCDAIEEKGGNLTAVLCKAGQIVLEDRPIPEIKDNEVLVRMGCVGICGSDVHYYVHGRIADFVVEKPMVIGHEGSGTVEQVGKNVKNLKPGDKVALEPGIPCRDCHFCKIGRYNLCPEVKFCATPPYDGNLCQYYAHPADFCFKLPSQVSLEEGALLEPLSVGIHACRKGRVNMASIVLIMGAGPIGLVTLIAAKALGAKKVIITDLLQYKLCLAKELGADCAMLVNEQECDEMAEKIKCVLGGNLPDVTVDCSGCEPSLKLALEVTKTGGTMVAVGMGCDEVTLSLGKAAILREVTIKGIFRYANDYPAALALAASKKFNLKKLITHKYDLEQTVEAFEQAKAGEGNPIKIMLYCDKKEKY